MAMPAGRKLEDCCKPAIPTSDRRCPSCGRHGKRVSRLTVSVFVRDPWVYLHPELLPPGDYSICENRSCSVVYFNSHSESVIRKDDIRAKVWQKEDDPSVPACYCFNNSVNSIAKEFEQNDTTNVLARIKAEVRAGNCRCEVTNPQGSCCLGNVTKAIKVAKELANPATAV